LSVFLPTNLARESQTLPF